MMKQYAIKRTDGTYRITSHPTEFGTRRFATPDIEKATLFSKQAPSARLRKDEFWVGVEITRKECQ
jgi:hypothetical protein